MKKNNGLFFSYILFVLFFTCVNCSQIFNRTISLSLSSAVDDINKKISNQIIVFKFTDLLYDSRSNILVKMDVDF